MTRRRDSLNHAATTELAQYSILQRVVDRQYVAERLEVCVRARDYEMIRVGACSDHRVNHGRLVTDVFPFCMEATPPAGNANIDRHDATLKPIAKCLKSLFKLRLESSARFVLRFFDVGFGPRDEINAFLDFADRDRA